ncbi:MAG TPA: YjjI family glycine radical enzyme [Feifaniaceae bacterium]|nr:YjjI family glycine radical enzyme [Feifaniaceae bacterium]
MVEQLLNKPGLTYRQRLFSLAREAENSIAPIRLSERAQWFLDRGIISDMGEGNAPYRPRYVVPDYDAFLKQGSGFLMIDPPRTLFEAVSALIILYHHIPSVTGLPVYIGHLDRLLEPYIKDEREASALIQMLLTHVDRTVSDSFCHCDIGPRDTRAGRIILSLTKRLQRPCPNMSLIYSSDTPDDFAKEAIACGLSCSKPSFVNDGIYASEWGPNYAIVSCYNALPVGGGGYTLGRMNLRRLGEEAHSEQHLLNTLLPEAVAAQCEQMDKRVSYIVEDCRFFEHSFLAEEGLIFPDRFAGMFGLVGMAECVNTVLHAVQPAQRYGRSEEAAALAERILNGIHAQVRAYRPKYGEFFLHGQVGVSTDRGVTPNVRIPVGEEPDLPAHIAFTARMQKHFACGVGELFPFEPTASKNPQAVLDIIRGAFSQGMRYFSYYSSDADLIRVTGYLVKRSDVERYRQGRAALNGNAALGSDAFDNLHVLGRRIRDADGA